MAATGTIAEADRDLLAKWEEELKDRFTEKDEEFMKVYNLEAPKPPIVESWWVPHNQGRRNDRRFNRQSQPHRSHGNRDNYERGSYNDHGRGYSDRGYDDRSQGYGNRNNRFRPY